jgi:hypothetical protein
MTIFALLTLQKKTNGNKDLFTLGDRMKFLEQKSHLQ